MFHGALVPFAERRKIIKGVGNVLFGGEGLFNTVVYGPGTVILQSMPIASTAMQLYQYMPHPSNN